MAADTIRFIVTVAIVVYKGLIPVVGRMLTVFCGSASESGSLAPRCTCRMTEAQADSLLRADLRKLYKMCSRFGKDALLAQCCPIMSDITG